MTSWRRNYKDLSNCFEPINLYKLCLLRCQDDLYRDQIFINKGILKKWKLTGSYKNYGTWNTFWSHAFLNYIMILIVLFGLTISTFYLALAKFHEKIIKLSTIYQWQDGLLSLALDFHIHVEEGQPTDPNR